VLAASQAVSLNNRVGGADRYETAAKVALAAAGCAPGFNPGTPATCANGVGPRVNGNVDAQSVVVASGENFPDALSANYLATSQRTVILLTRANSLPQATKDAICELGAQRVFLVGGTAAISAGVENTLKSLQQHNQGCNGLIGGGNVNLEVSRIAGANRYETNRLVDEYAAGHSFQSTTVGLTNITYGVPGKRTAFVTTGENFPDALAAGAATVAGNYPVILTPGASLGSDAASTLNAIDIDQVVIVGGSDVVSSSTESAISGKGIAVKRIAGADRYETATKLADFEVTPFNATPSREGGLGFDDLSNGDDQTAFLATGAGYADALAAGPLAGQLFGTFGPSPILLTTPSPLSSATKQWLDDHSSSYNLVQAIGLAQAVSNAALTEANQVVSN
jgi:putative cell wall-binding protein